MLITPAITPVGNLPDEYILAPVQPFVPDGYAEYVPLLEDETLKSELDIKRPSVGSTVSVSSPWSSPLWLLALQATNKQIVNTNKLTIKTVNKNFLFFFITFPYMYLYILHIVYVCDYTQ